MNYDTILYDLQKSIDDVVLIEQHKGEYIKYEQVDDVKSLKVGNSYLCKMYNGEYITLRYLGVEKQDNEDILLFEFDYVSGVKIEITSFDVRYVLAKVNY